MFSRALLASTHRACGSLRHRNFRANASTKDGTRSGENLAAKSETSTFGVLQDLDVFGDVSQNTQRVTIDAIGQDCFTVNGLHVRGSVMLFPHFATMWNVSRSSEVLPIAFTMVRLIKPRPDIVIIGLGAQSKPISSELGRYFADSGINVDFMDTVNACHTFNILNQEGRNAVAGLLPSISS